MGTDQAGQLLLLSGAIAIFWSSLLGLFMMIPHLKMEPLTRLAAGVNFRHLLAAHLDWIMLAFMQGLAAGLIAAFGLTPSMWVVGGIIFGGWMNAVPYFLRAFGINAFVYGGDLVQKLANILGAISVLTLIVCWGVLIARAIPLLLG